MIKIRVSPHAKDENRDSEVKYSEDVYNKVLDFVRDIITKMGYCVDLKIESSEGEYIKISIETNSPSILIGREGRNLDALQLLANIYASKLIGKNGNFNKVILDIEDYRERFKSRFINLAISSLHKVKRSRRSILLPTMNPFERRIIHTTLNRYNDVRTESEGDGNLKRVRISYVRNSKYNSNVRSYQRRGH